MIKNRKSDNQYVFLKKKIIFKVVFLAKKRYSKLFFGKKKGYSKLFSDKPSGIPIFLEKTIIFKQQSDFIHCFFHKKPDVHNVFFGTKT